MPRRLYVDIEAHNAETRAVWEAFHAGKPKRVPVSYSMNPRMILLDPALNQHGCSFEQYFSDPQVALRVQIEFQYWRRHNVLDDSEMGLPKEWSVSPDLQNCYEAMWFEAPVLFPESQTGDSQPTCHPILAAEGKSLLFDRGLPEPLDGSMGKAWEMREFLRQRRREGFEYLGRPLGEPGMVGLATDGPFTVAAALRGASELCADIYEDPGYVQELLGFIVDATVLRIQRLRALLDQDPRPERWGFADDSIALLSEGTYWEFVLPCHKRLLEELAGSGPHSMHLCGDATRHFPLMRRELNINSFDTGFPVDFAWLRRTLGPEVTIRGGPSVARFLRGTPAEVAEETRRILSSGIMEGGKFILGEGNNMPPRTPIANMDACYWAAVAGGKYPGWCLPA